MFKRAGFSILVALFCVQATLLGDEPSAEEFGKSVAQANMRLRNAGFDFGKQLGPILRSNPVDAAALAATYAKLVKTLAQVKGEMAKQKFPESQEAKDLSAAHQQFLQGQTDMIANDLADVVVIAVNANKNANEKKTQIEKLLNEMTKREQADNAKLLQALQAYVDKYDLDVNALLKGN